MCSVWKGRKDGLDTVSIENLLRQARQLGARKFVPFGAEIFMRKDTVAILEAAVRLGFRHLSVVTNGMLLRPHLARLADLPGLHLGISIDGPEPIHNALRGPGSYSKARDGLEGAVAAGLTVAIKSVLMKPTLDHLDHLIDLAKTTGLHRVSIQPFQPEIAGLTQDHSAWEFSPQDRAHVAGKLAHLLDSARLQGVEVETEELFPLMLRYLFEGHRPVPPRGCHLPDRFILVTGRGETYPCFFMRGQSMGNVAAGLRLQDIWHGPLQQKMAMRGKSGACPGCLASCSDVPNYTASDIS